MRPYVLIGCLMCAALLLVGAAPVDAALSTTTLPNDSITAISPNFGYANNKVTSFTITGVNFTTVRGSVQLEKSGSSPIQDYDIVSWSTGNQVDCQFRISTSKATGTWNVVVIKFDGSTIVKEGAFTILDQPELTSISPTTARAGDSSVDFVLTGKNFDKNSIDDVFLYNKNYDNISADSYDVDSETKITGTFDLNSVEEATYEVCVKDNFERAVCDPKFEVTTNKVGSIDISSEPSGASIFINGIANGTTPNTIDDLIVGSYKVILRKPGYEEWGKTVTVTDGDTSTVDVKLYAAATATPVQTPYQEPTIPPTAVRTTKPPAKSTLKIPTTYAEVPTTAASPVEPALVIGTIGLAIVAFRRR